MPTDQPPDPHLLAEQDRLSASRSALRLMRDRVSRLQAHGGDAVSTEYLKATLWHRMLALEDDPDIPLFFGRLDYADPPERFYIGRRHVTDSHGDPLVVDWRAEISRAFYRASPREPMGVELRRRFGFAHGQMTAYEDERLIRSLDQEPGAQPTSGAGASTILEAEIERPRTGPMRDIVATIQPEQDDIVRADLATTVCVQGAPGTGKTAVGLHRAAYLLYTFREQVARQGVLVIGPNDSFLRYIEDVLPALGEIDAVQRTVTGLTARVRIRAADDAARGRLLGDARIAQVVERAVWDQLRTPQEALVVPRGTRRWRIPTYEADDLVAGLRARGVRYGTGRAMLAQRLAHAVLVKMEAGGDSPDDRVQDAVARSKPVKAYVDWCWPRVDPVKVVFSLLGDARALARASEGVLDEDEQSLIGWSTAPRSAGAARWTPAEAVLVDEATDIVERTPSVAHVVLDEAQDLSPMMLRAVGRRCSTGSMTVLGDLAQATTPWGATSWVQALSHLGQPDAHVEELTQGFRVPGDVIDLAARLLPRIAPGLAPPVAVRRSRGELRIVRVDALVPAGVDGVAALKADEGSVGLIVPDMVVAEVSAALATAKVEHVRVDEGGAAEATVTVVPAALAKGLEFDHVVLLEPAAIVAGEADEVTGLRRLYVCLTRAVTSLLILHTQELPADLAS